MAACERAVSEAESNPQIDPYGRAQIRDSRGVARAMHGDFAGAIDDFSFFVSHARAGAAPELFKRRESWLAMLKQDRNPFDAATLQTLRIE
jgi:regulator of sirC expression with transglutaminase-like and TPR domain